MVYIFTECGTKFGYGHVIRCIALYDEIIKQGHQAYLVINSDQDIQSILGGRNYKVSVWYDNIDTYFLKGKYVIVDSYIAKLDTYEIIANMCKKALYIDDTNRIQYPKGLIVNPCIGAMHIPYETKNNQEYLLGMNYFILREAFLQETLYVREIKESVTDVLIMLGGSDIKNLTPILLKCLNAKEYSGIRKHVILGNGFDNGIEIQQEATKGNVILYKNLDDKQICDLMKLCDFAITAAGQTVNEMIAMQLPFICIKVADNQINNIKMLLENKLVISYLDMDNKNENVGLWIKKQVREIINYDNRKNITSKFKELGLRKGTKNIISKLLIL